MLRKGVFLLKKYIFGLIIKFVLASIMLAIPFVIQDSAAIKLIASCVIFVMWLFVSMAFRHPQAKESEKYITAVVKFQRKILLYLFPFCFIFVNTIVFLMLLELPDNLLTYFSKGTSDVVLHIIKATFWGNAIMLIWEYGSLIITCVILFLFLKWVKNYLRTERGLDGPLVNWGGILASTIFSVGIIATLCISFTILENSFGVVANYYKDIKYYQSGTVEEYQGLILVGRLEELESAYYEKQPQPLQLLIGYYPIHPTTQDTENVKLHCPVELLENIELLEKANYIVQYLPNTNIVTSIVLAEE